MRAAHTIFLDLADGLADKCGMKRLVNIANVLSGVAPPKRASSMATYVQIKDLKEAGEPLLHAAAPSAKRATPIEASDILVPSRGEGLIAFQPAASMVGAYAALDVYLIRPQTEQVDPTYLIIALNSPSVQKELRMAATGSALPRIPKQALEEAQIPVPSFDRQRRIGAIGALARRSEDLQKQRAEAETRLNAALVSRILESAA